MQLLINCFPVEIAPEEFTLPAVNVRSWDDSTSEIKNRFPNFSVSRAKNSDGSIGVFLLDGPPLTETLGSKLVGGDRYQYVVSEIVMFSLVAYFRSRGLSVFSSHFESTVTTPAPQYTIGDIEIRTGISIRIRLPPTQQTSGVRLLMARWEVKRDFRSNLDNGDLRRICLGKPVLYHPSQTSSDESVPADFIRRYLGHVIAVRSDAEIDVSCRDGVNRTIPSKDLRLEATTATLAEYEKTSGQRSGRSIWHRTQELAFVLTTSGRRNTTVLRDRLDAVRKFLGQDTSPAIVLPALRFAPIKLSLGLSPLTAEIAAHV